MEGGGDCCFKALSQILPEKTTVSFSQDSSLTGRPGENKTTVVTYVSFRQVTNN
jgi:hypothetical protein